ncbi:MAG: RloB family protein [Firmicutes bacterium]|nr:RloB family protein [Bacillota bacterium]
MRRPGLRPTKKLWIICEGKTEKLYFDKLRIDKRISRLEIKTIKSGHQNADGIIQDAIGFIARGKDFQKNDLVACVFDRDANTDLQFGRAKSLATKNKILISFSNPCFEYWILCHFGYFPSSYEKDTLIKKIQDKFADYISCDPELYNKTKEKLNKAKIYAKMIKKKHVDDGKELIKRTANPLSLVFELVELIEKFKD